MSGLADLSGKAAVVTGGASGIGRGIAERLIAAGSDVTIADIDASAVAETAAQIGAIPQTVDVRDAVSVQALADAVLARYGRIDILVNNAGVGPLAPITELTLEDFHWVLDINLIGVVNGIKIFLPLLLANPEGGHIVNTASMAGLMNGPGMGAYAASKAAVVAITEVLAAELEAEGSKVGASVLTPALVRSNIGANAQKRPGKKGDLTGDNSAHLPPGRMLEAAEVGDLVVGAIRHGDLYIVTHPEDLPLVKARHERIERAFTEGG